MDYNFIEIEKKWQDIWKKNKTFKVENNSDKPKFYVLDMFPYPSGAGLHVGHPLGYIASDIYTRYKNLTGFNVLHPMGFDAFGLPAEQYAIQTGQHPAVTTENNIIRYKEQLEKIGFAYDWEREFRTSEPSYYKWTQWVFIKLFNHWYNNKPQKAEPIENLIELFNNSGNTTIDAANNCEITFSAEEWQHKTDNEKQKILLCYRLAYLAKTMVNWCPALGTVLANDEVKEAISVRGGHPVEQRKMLQWCLRITAYAERLLTGLHIVEWTDSLKEMQRNWIGKSVGAEIKFKVQSLKFKVQDCEGSNLSPTLSKGEGAKKESGNNSTPSYVTTDSKNWNSLIEFAKENRKNPTEAEELLWQELRNNNIGFKIRRQHPVGEFIPDFICISKKTIIEIDGGIHKTQIEYDKQRANILEENGFSILIFNNEEVISNPKNIANKIKDYLNAKVLSFGEDLGEVVVFTTRPDTIFGCTFMVLAPEHELITNITTPEQKSAIEEYITKTKKRTERERMTEVNKISGCFTGAYAIHPFTNLPIPIWLSDYVLAGYGTGAIMAVPAHDSRDFAFARYFNLPIIQVIKKYNEELTETSTWAESFDAKEGTCINSDFINGLHVVDAIDKIISKIEEMGIGKRMVNYRLRDAIFSRQRYWGEPFPIYYKDELPCALPENKLPLELPEMDSFLPTSDGQPPLSRAANWKTKDGYPLELSTMPGFAGSSGYYFRYMDPTNNNEFVSKEAINYWKDVDLYIGGTEHATGHLIYSRFWCKFLHDIGIAPVEEPFKKLINQGMIQGRSNFIHEIVGTGIYISNGIYNNLIKNKTEEFRNLLRQIIIENSLSVEKLKLFDESGISIMTNHVDVNIVINDVLDIEAYKKWSPDNASAEFILEDGKYICGYAIEKMSKSMYNVVNPDSIIEKYGADTLRMYEMFLGPLEQAKPWDTAGIEGVHRFLRKFWKLYHDETNSLKISDEQPTAQELKTFHKLIKKVKDDIEQFSFNTSVSAFMICINELTDLKCNKRQILESLVIVLSPFAPHIAEEIWQLLEHNESILKTSYPIFDESLVKENSKVYPVSFNGKVRFQLELPLSLASSEIEKIALENEQTKKWLDGKQIKKIIVVPQKIINIVV
ncbi:MAG: leucine--tRNA ligase [Bacteroidetes bacterium GWA2_32_17]|nr:MAG: leucine--tRNA ligase [Bacteroidetes bacterium GWA2_32_17]